MFDPQHFSGIGQHRVVAVLDHVLSALVVQQGGQFGPPSPFFDHEVQHDDVLLDCPALSVDALVQVVVPVLSALLGGLEVGSSRLQKDVSG